MLSNETFEIRPTFNEYSQEFHCNSFLVKLGIYFGSCNTLIDLSSKVYIPNKTEDFSLSVSNTITGIYQSKSLTKHLSCEYKCRFDGKNGVQIYGGIMINVHASVTKFIYMKKNTFEILVNVFAKIGNI